MAIEFTLNPKQLADLQRVLNPKQLKQGIYQAVSRTTNKGLAIAGKAVLERLTIPKKYVNDKKNRYAAIKSKVVKGDSPAGYINVKQISLPLSAFKMRATKKGGVTITTDKQSPPIVLRHGFVAKVRSKRQEELGVAHTGVFLRARVKLGDAAQALYLKHNRASKLTASKRGAVTPKGFAWRLPIAEQFGPSVLDYITKREIESRVLSEIGNEFEKQIGSQLSRFTQGKFTSLTQLSESFDITDEIAAP